MNCWENVIVSHSWWWNGQQSVFVVHWTSNTCFMCFFVLSFTFTTNASEWKCTDATLKIDGTLSGQEIKGTFTFNSSGVLTAPSEYSYSCVSVTMKHNKTLISFKNFQVRLMTCSSLKNSPIMDSHALCNITTYLMQYDHFFRPMEFKHHPWRIFFYEHCQSRCSLTFMAFTCINRVLLSSVNSLIPESLPDSWCSFFFSVSCENLFF